MNYKLILASASPRRRELIKYLGMPFDCLSVDTDESIEERSPKQAVMAVSLRKARAALKLKPLQEGEIIIGADTIVATDNEILGKPKNDIDAFNTLKKLQGKSHYVYTGVTFIYTKKNEHDIPQILEKTFYEKTEVHFMEISNYEIECYIKTGDCNDKAGSYAIQGEFSKHISGINGDYNNVVGFPVARIYKELKLL